MNTHNHQRLQWNQSMATDISCVSKQALHKETRMTEPFHTGNQPFWYIIHLCVTWGTCTNKYTACRGWGISWVPEVKMEIFEGLIHFYTVRVMVQGICCLINETWFWQYPGLTMTIDDIFLSGGLEWKISGATKIKTLGIFQLSF